MNISVIIGVMAGVFTLTGLLAGGYIILRSTLSKTTSQLWQEEAEALQARLVTVENSDKDCKARLAVLENANRVLADQVSGTTAVSMLSEQLDKQHDQVVKHQKEIMRALEDLK